MSLTHAEARSRLEIFLSPIQEKIGSRQAAQFAIEILKDLEVCVWTYERDQEKSQTANRKESQGARAWITAAVIFLASPSTLAPVAQWMELAYADAFDVPIFVLLHQMTFKTLKAMEEGVAFAPRGAVSLAAEWQTVVAAIRDRLDSQMKSGAR